MADGDKRRLVPGQNVGHLVVPPTLVPKLDGVTDADRQHMQERIKPLDVLVQRRRQLPQDHAQPLELEDAVETPPQRLFEVGQLLQVCHRARAFDHEVELRPEPRVPCLDRRRCRVAVERRVHLDSIELRRVERQPLGALHVVGIERPLPIVVRPPRRADECAVFFLNHLTCSFAVQHPASHTSTTSRNGHSR